MVVLSDVTQAELADSLDGAPVPIHWVDASGTIVWANQAELDMLGYRPGEYIGKPIAEFHEDKALIAVILEKLLSGQDVKGQQAVLLGKDGSRVVVTIDSNAYCVDGNFVHSRCFTRMSVAPAVAALQ